MPPDVLIPIAAVASALAATTGTVISSAQASKARKAQKAASEAALRTAAEAQRRDRLGVLQEERSQKRRSSGSGQQGTILGGVDSQTEISRKVLLGQ